MSTVEKDLMPEDEAVSRSGRDGFHRERGVFIGTCALDHGHGFTGACSVTF